MSRQCSVPKGLVPPMIIGCSEEYSCADAELVLSIALKVSNFGVKVVGLNGSDPDVFGDGYVQAATDGVGE